MPFVVCRRFCAWFRATQFRVRITPSNQGQGKGIEVSLEEEPGQMEVSDKISRNGSLRRARGVLVVMHAGCQIRGGGALMGGLVRRSTRFRWRQVA
jgi:hypothetical protein